GLAPFPDRRRLLDDLATPPRHGERARQPTRRSLHSLSVSARLESVGGTVRPQDAPRLRRARRAARLRQRRGERSLPPLARLRRARAVPVPVARRGDPPPFPGPPGPCRVAPAV